MATLFLIFISLCVVAMIKLFIMFRSRSDGNKKLPPGPSLLSSHLLVLTNTLFELEPILNNLKSKYGPLITLSVGLRRFIFVSSHSLAHKILIQNGSISSDRPKTIHVRNITLASYGPTWRLLRRNLTSGVLHAGNVSSCSWARKWALEILIARLHESESGVISNVFDHFQHAMFGLLVLMCFGQKLDGNHIDEIANAQRRALVLLGSRRYNVLRLIPRFGKILLGNRWKDLKRVLIPLIKSRIKTIGSEKPQGVEGEQIVAYIDTLVNLQLPEEDASNGGKLTEMEMVTMCGEFMNAGTETTFTSLQWIMANLVKYPHIQSKLYDEIVAVVGPPLSPPRKGVELELSVINEEDLKKMAYLKAVVLEGLRRHPPVHFVLPHRVEKEVQVQGYVIPEGATINFMVGEMGLDPTVWDDPMEFKPERFLVNDSNSNGVFDISGSKEIKMMPFGAGRRICPGLDLGMLHLEYFVANLIWYFNWSAPNGYNVDLSEKIEFSVVMKNPLQAQISSRVT